MTTKHALKYNGAPYDAEGELLNPDTNITRGEGRAKCICGALSPEPLPNGVARRSWFKEHKANPEAWTVTSQTVTWSDAPESVPDEIPLDPEAVETAEQDSEPEEASEPAAPAVSVVLPFEKTKDLAAHFWRYLGRDGVRRLDELGVFGPGVTISTNASNHTLHIGGPTDSAVAAATDLIKTYWSEAVETGKEWKKTDPDWLARPRGGLAMRKASFHMMGEYYLAYADVFVESHGLG